MRNDLMQRAALLSLCGKYRYRLGRCRVSSLPLAFVRLNPRTIDADVVDQATIRSRFGVVKTHSIDSVAELANLLASGEHRRNRSPLLEMVERMERWPRTCAPPAKRWPARAISRLRATRIEDRRWPVRGGADRREELRDARRPHLRDGRPPALHETRQTAEATGAPLDNVGLTIEFGVSRIHAQQPDMPAPVGRWTAGCDQHELVRAQAGDAK